MKKVYIVTDIDGDIRKVFTSRQFADKYMETLSDMEMSFINEPEEYEVEK